VIVADKLSDKELAMLELIEFGIDRWSSAEGREMAYDLFARGLITLERQADDSEGGDLICTITAEGSLALELARMPSSGKRRDQRDSLVRSA
jgi:hypothetical protein